MKQLKPLFLIAILTLIVLGQPQPAAVAQGTVTIISDGTFNDEDWSIFKVVSEGGTNHTVQQAPSGGNSGTFRSMTHTLPPVPPGDLAKILVTHLYLGDSYDPGLQGAIDHINYAENGKMLSLPWPDAHSITYFALVQDNRLFLSKDFIDFIGNTTWESDILTNLTASDFAADDGSGDPPDFSASGGVIQFGYARFNTRTETLPPVPPDQDLVYEHGIDNWAVTIFPDEGPPGNAPPVAEDDTAIVGFTDSVSINALKNDSDPDGDKLRISNYTSPQHGTFSLVTYFSFIYSHSGGSTVDSFVYTVTDGELTDTADVLILVDCGCTTECLAELNSTTLKEDVWSISPFPFRSSSFLSHTSIIPQMDNIDLSLIYRVRDEVMKPTPHGSRYVNMYYHTNPEILKILLIDSTTLRNEAVATVELWQNNLRDLVDGDGTAIITQAQVNAIKNFLTNLSAAASPELQQIIADELVRLGPLDDYVGMTVKEAKSKAIGDPTIYLPIVLKP